MASNVFGNPITTATLEGMPEYRGRAITRRDRAHVAFLMKNADERDTHARQYVENLQQRWGDGVSTLCVVYNATGDTLTFITSHDWLGHDGPSPYPMKIQNGQWCGFLHVQTSGQAAGSAAAVVYRGKNDAGEDRDWMQSWYNADGSDNKAYTEVREGGHYNDRNNLWDLILNLVRNSGLNATDNWGGCYTMAAIGNGTSAIFEGIMMLESDSDA